MASLLGWQPDKFQNWNGGDEFLDILPVDLINSLLSHLFCQIIVTF